MISVLLAFGELTIPFSNLGTPIRGGSNLAVASMLCVSWDRNVVFLYAQVI
jgi:hypothetical protein